MKYMGGKTKIAEPIVKIIQETLTYYSLSHYLEPFVGGANVIDKVQCEHRYASDKQKYLIALFNNVDRLSELPEMVSKEHYSAVREDYKTNAGKYEDWYIGAVGFLASYNGRFFDGGYSGTVTTRNGKVRNYYVEAKNNLSRQADSLKGIIFCNKDYEKVRDDISGYIIYCDPPYKGTKQYGCSRNFDSDGFFEWCRKMSLHNIVLISEEHAPDDFKCVWEKEQKRTINNAGTKKSTEKLFEYQVEKAFGIKEPNFSRKLEQEDIKDLEEIFGKKFPEDIGVFKVNDIVRVKNVMQQNGDASCLWEGRTGRVVKETFYLGKKAYLVRFAESILIRGKEASEELFFGNELELAERAGR